MGLQRCRLNHQVAEPHSESQRSHPMSLSTHQRRRHATNDQVPERSQRHAEPKPAHSEIRISCFERPYGASLVEQLPLPINCQKNPTGLREVLTIKQGTKKWYSNLLPGSITPAS